MLVPSLGESVTEATVSKWLKKVGEEVDSDEPLVELETDKVNIEVPSPLSGTLTEIKVQAGDTVEVGALLGIINEEKTVATTTSTGKNGQQQTHAQTKTLKRKTSVNKSKKPNLKKQETLKLVDVVKEEGEKEEPFILDTLAENDSEVRNTDSNFVQKEKQKYISPIIRQNLSPAVRKIAEENQIDISNLKGSGKDGRISKGDLMNLMGNNPQPSTRKMSHGPRGAGKNDKIKDYNCQTFKRSSG